jgi:hypothetical protein
MLRSISVRARQAESVLRILQRVSARKPSPCYHMASCSIDSEGGRPWAAAWAAAVAAAALGAASSMAMNNNPAVAESDSGAAAPDPGPKLTISQAKSYFNDLESFRDDVFRKLGVRPPTITLAVAAASAVVAAKMALPTAGVTTVLPILARAMPVHDVHTDADGRGSLIFRASDGDATAILEQARPGASHALTFYRVSDTTCRVRRCGAAARSSGLWR